MQEESEGYAKVLDFLVRGEPSDEEGRRCRLRQLLGTFELDPNRVMEEYDIPAYKNFETCYADLKDGKRSTEQVSEENVK